MECSGTNGSSKSHSSRLRNLCSRGGRKTVSQMLEKTREKSAPAGYDRTTKPVENHNCCAHLYSNGERLQ